MGEAEMISIKFGSTGKASRRIEELYKKLGVRVADALYAVGDNIVKESQELVPTDTMGLKESVAITRKGWSWDTVVRVGYGKKGFVVYRRSTKSGKMVLREPYKYALYVHEDMTVPHDDGQALFLEQAARNLPVLRQVLRQALGAP